jgi:hypothetical protein
MQIVVNEWLLDYLRPDSNQQHKDLALRFLRRFRGKADKIVIRDPSPFMKKYFKQMKSFGRDTEYKKISTVLKSIFLDSDKTVIIRDEDVTAVPINVSNEVKRDKPDDYYLVEAAYSSVDRLIITTDTPLHQLLGTIPDLRVYLLPEFLRGY